MKIKHFLLLVAVSFLTTAVVTFFAFVVFPNPVRMSLVSPTATATALEQPTPEAVPNPPTEAPPATPNWWAITESTEEVDWDELCKLYKPEPPADYPLQDRHAGEGVNGTLARVDELVFQIVLEAVPPQPPLVNQMAEFSLNVFDINEHEIESDNPGLELDDSDIRVWVALSEHRNMNFVLVVKMADGQVFEILLGDLAFFAAPCDIMYAESRTQTPAPPIGDRA